MKRVNLYDFISYDIDFIVEEENECGANQCDLCSSYLDIGETCYYFVMKNGESIFTCEECGDMIIFNTDKPIIIG